MRQLGDKEALQCSTCARIATAFLWKTTSGGFLGEGRNNWWCAICGEKNDWKQPNRLLVGQTGKSINQAKVFKAHAVPQGLCGNLINELKLLANQQEEGDGLIQNIVTNLGERSREGLTIGLREFIKVDNQHALEVGYLARAWGNSKYEGRKFQKSWPEVTVREGLDELRLRAEEVRTLKTYINVTHIKNRDGVLPG